ncbi:MAG: class I SAM-dependent methyltransferase [Defluviitaleaceae bacterium]|nr:class I SAM-dependent methyltransferase [Defluviitaleaceae bacterium]
MYESQTLAALERFYSNQDEDGRLITKHGQIEFLTTMRYIDRYLKPGDRVADIGAGTGRYSLAAASLGCAVEAVELVERNIDVFKRKIGQANGDRSAEATTGAGQPSEYSANINITRGNALALTMLESGAFDITLLLGPLYHLYTHEDKRQAISEALRVTKPGGVVFAAYCLTDACLAQSGFKDRSFDILDYCQSGKVDMETFSTFSTPEDVFELVRKEDVDRLMEGFGATRLHYVATDLFACYMAEALEAMDRETYEMYLRYHFAVCERADLAGVSNHALDVFRKE